jgi:hypothetical protein
MPGMFSQYGEYRDYADRIEPRIDQTHSADEFVPAIDLIFASWNNKDVD